jgi:methionine-rich copper-binding protein CopC
MSKARAGVAAFVAVLGVLSTLMLALAGPALAHDELLTSSPADGSTVTKLPSTVTLVFEEPPAAGFTKMTVSGPGGASINSTGPQVVGARITESLKATTMAGTYVINFRIMSDDGHPVSGTIHFTLTAPGSAEHVASSAKPGGHADSSSSLTYVAGGVLVVLALAVLGASRARRARTAPLQSKPDDRELVES